MCWPSSLMHFPTLNMSYVMIVIASLLLNTYYAYEWHTRCESSYLFPKHASQVGYNFYRYGTITRLYEGSTYKYHGVVGTGHMQDRAPNMKDTIGYGVLLGLLWKATGATQFYWVILLQVLLLTLSLCLLYQAIFWFYQDRQKAAFSIFGVFAFLPAFYLNVQPVKDMWSFYGTVVLLWALIGLMQHKIDKKILCGSAVFFAVCQWMRPTVFGVLMVLLIIGLPVFYIYFKHHVGVLKKLLIYFFIANLMVFWVPFVLYNKVAFNRFFVGPTGLALLVSFADFPNPWGVECSEDWVARHVQERYPNLDCVNETQEFDDAAKSIFIEYFEQEPFLYFKNLLYRVLGMFFVNMPWTAQFSDFVGYNSCHSKFEALCQAWHTGVFETVRFCFFFLYIRLFLLLAYVGFFWLLLEKQFILPFLVIIAVVGNCGEVLSHIELKYLMQCYGFLGIFAGLFVFFLQSKVKTIINHNRFYRKLCDG